MSWVDEFAPKQMKDIVGQQAQVKQIADFIRTFPQKRRALMVWGPTGCGKTSSVYAVARELGLELHELNASDVRNKSELEPLLNHILGQQSLFGTKKLILIDELEGISGQKDRGAVPTIAGMIPKSAFPIILVCENPEGNKVKPLKKVSTLFEFHELNHLDIKEVLKRICKEKNVKFDDKSLAQLARNSGGDLRAAITDLQVLSADGNLSEGDVLASSPRDLTESMQDALTKVFKTLSADVAKGTFNNIMENIDELFLWMEENLPAEYTKPFDISRAMSALARADEFFARIRKWQYYRYYVYCYDLLSVGVALAKDERYSHSISYKPSSRILKMWIAKQKHARAKGIASKLAKITHTSQTRAYDTTVPYLKHLTKKGMIHRLDLDDEELEWLKTH